MRHVARWIAVGTLALGGLAGTAVAHEKEEGHAHQKVKMSDLPPPVRSTFQKESQGGKIEELRSETRDGKTIYEGEVISNGKGTNLEVSQDGTVLERSTPHDEATEGAHER
jgi:hypothetical protein